MATRREMKRQQMIKCPDEDIRTVFREALLAPTYSGLFINLLSTLIQGTGAVNQCAGQYLKLDSCCVSVTLSLNDKALLDKTAIYPVTVILAQSLDKQIPLAEEFWGDKTTGNGLAGSIYAPLGAQRFVNKQQYPIYRIQRFLLGAGLQATYTFNWEVSATEFVAECVEFDNVPALGLNINSGAVFVAAFSNVAQLDERDIFIKCRSRITGYPPN